MKIDITKATNIKEISEIREIIGIKKFMEILKIAKAKLTKKTEKLIPGLSDTTYIAVSKTSINHRKLKKLLAIDYPSFSAILPYRYYWK